MPNYKVVFKAEEKEIGITVEADNDKQAVGKAAKFLRVGVGEIKLKTSYDFK